MLCGRVQSRVALTTNLLFVRLSNLLIAITDDVGDRQSPISETIRSQLQLSKKIVKSTAQIQRLVPLWKPILFPQLYSDAACGTSGMLAFEDLDNPASLATCYRSRVNDKEVADALGVDPVDRLDLGLALHTTGPQYAEVLVSTCIAVTLDLLPQVFAAVAKSTEEGSVPLLSTHDVMSGLVDGLVKHLDMLHPNEYATREASLTLQDDRRQVMLEEALSVFHDVISRARYVHDLIRRWELEEAVFRPQIFNGDQLMAVRICANGMILESVVIIGLLAGDMRVDQPESLWQSRL